jgi:PAS domain S-box-containing protein
VRLLLLEPRDSAYASRIENAAKDAGLNVSFLDSLEATPIEAPLIGVGPSARDPMQMARHLRAICSEALLVFFAASSSAVDALRAELVRDPFLYPRYELIELPASPRQLATRIGTVVATVERQLHSSPGTRRDRRARPKSNSRQSTSLGAQQDVTSVLAHAPDAIFSTDTACRVLTWNEASQRLFGFRAQAALGRAIEILAVPEIPADSTRQLCTVLRRVFVSNAPEHTQVLCATRAGEVLNVSASIAPIRDARGDVVGASVIARDDSEYQRVEEALREANRQKDEFLAIMSHELRTPLTSILGYTDMLLRGLSGPLPPLTNKYIGNVRSAGDRLLELVNGLLDYTRLEAGVERLELQPVDVSRVVGQVVQHFQAQARSKGIELRLAIAKGVAARIEADEEKLTHVLRSFIGNALKFTPDAGWVAVYVGPDPEVRELVRVSVVDSGIGMADEQIARVWERFYQGDASLTRAYGGMGLGLSIARHLVTLHGGTVGAESAGPGRGSTFWFTLPLRHSS